MTGRLSLSVYVHWPFCRSKCGYCDFNSFAGEDQDFVSWQKAYESAIDRLAARLGADRYVDTVFFGGGTPSTLPPAFLAALLERLSRHWPLAPHAEISLEANPASLTLARCSNWRSVGINRLSIGVQAFDDAILHWLGRRHTADQARRAAALARRFFEHLNLDLIYACPGQSPSAWRQTLHEAVARTGDHLSCYQLSLAPETPLGRQRVSGAFDLPDEDRAAALFDLTRETLSAAGFPAYEVSNHARPGGACRHNLAVWQGGDYAGIGPGAHGRIRIDGRMHATEQISSPAPWHQQVTAGGSGDAVDDEVSPTERAVELVLTGLRMTQGLDISTLTQRTGTKPTGIRAEAILAPDKIEDLILEGYLRIDGRYLQTTKKGLLCLDAVLRVLLTD